MLIFSFNFGLFLVFWLNNTLVLIWLFVLVILFPPRDVNIVLIKLFSTRTPVWRTKVHRYRSSFRFQLAQSVIGKLVFWRGHLRSNHSFWSLRDKIQPVSMMVLGYKNLSIIYLQLSKFIRFLCGIYFSDSSWVARSNNGGSVSQTFFRAIWWAGTADLRKHRLILMEINLRTLPRIHCLCGLEFLVSKKGNIRNWKSRIWLTILAFTYLSFFLILPLCD